MVEPKTGRITNRFDLPADEPGGWRNLRVGGNVVVGCAGRYLVCVDRQSGQMKWKHECGRSALSVALGGGKVFCAELVNRRKREVASEATKTRAFDAATGKIVWQTVGGSGVRYSEPHDLLVTAHGIYRGADGHLVTETTGFDRMHDNQWCDHLSIAGDRLLWGTPNSFVAYDLQSGERVGDLLNWVRRGCTGLRASPNLVTDTSPGQLCLHRYFVAGHNTPLERAPGLQQQLVSRQRHSQYPVSNGRMRVQLHAGVASLRGPGDD